ncbi:MAG TPA: energy transducer TonB [Candidatus Acidoferrum sp.]|nr:energy transducer TonB [Candidatus Acidoferrum sp.]
MPVEPRAVHELAREENLGSLRGCLVDGDAEQRGRERRVRRRAMAVSVVLQSAVLAAFLFVSLFGKGESIVLAKVTPIPPYSGIGDISHNRGASHPRGPQNPCHFCVPPRISPTIAIRDRPSIEGDPNEPTFPGMEPGVPGGPSGFISLPDPRPNVPPPDDPNRHVVRPTVVHMTHLDPGMLIHRVEPIYPPLARQIHKEGRVELRAVIATDGSIQSLQVVGGDPLFYQSALEAVRQWHYRATVLNGKAVEIDTSITVIYTMQH